MWKQVEFGGEMHVRSTEVYGQIGVLINSVVNVSIDINVTAQPTFFTKFRVHEQRIQPLAPGGPILTVTLRALIEAPFTFGSNASVTPSGSGWTVLSAGVADINGTSPPCTGVTDECLVEITMEMQYNEQCQADNSSDNVDQAWDVEVDIGCRPGFTGTCSALDAGNNVMTIFNFPFHTDSGLSSRGCDSDVYTDEIMFVSGWSRKCLSSNHRNRRIQER